MEWVAIDTDIGSDRVTYGISSEAKVSRREAVGILTLFFAGMARHAESGDLSAVLDEQIEDWCLWAHKPGTLAPLLRRYLCDEQGVVRAWEKWNGRMIEKAKKDRDRKRKARDEWAQRPRSVRGQSADIPRNGAGTRPDQTRPDLTTTAGTTPAADAAANGGGWPARVSAAWCANVGVIPPGRVGRDLRPFVRLFPTPEAGEAALLAAVENFTYHRRLAVQRGVEKPDNWAQFVRDLRDYVPPPLLPPPRAPEPEVAAT